HWRFANLSHLSPLSERDVTIVSAVEVAVQEGDGVTFQCSTSGDCMSSYIMFWYQQGPCVSLDWIYREGDAYGEGFQGGFKGRVLSSQNRLTLQMQAAKQGDEAVYYCGFFFDHCDLYIGSRYRGKRRQKVREHTSNCCKALH
uniref:Ig-like domain-containing protein n=1 Tax=Strix occidentalis caurina TaxID=311401 RepID=A0A8D0G186_STROC